MAGRAFWPRAIAAAPNVSELIEIRADSAHWRGPILRFTAVG